MLDERGRGAPTEPANLLGAVLFCFCMYSEEGDNAGHMVAEAILEDDSHLARSMRIAALR